jgi:uncharacterized protein YjbI with pentapeptide repeats
MAWYSFSKHCFTFQKPPFGALYGMPWFAYLLVVIGIFSCSKPSKSNESTLLEYETTATITVQIDYDSLQKNPAFDYGNLAVLLIDLGQSGPLKGKGRTYVDTAWADSNGFVQLNAQSYGEQIIVPITGNAGVHIVAQPTYYKINIDSASVSPGTLSLNNPKAKALPKGVQTVRFTLSDSDINHGKQAVFLYNEYWGPWASAQNKQYKNLAFAHINFSHANFANTEFSGCTFMYSQLDSMNIHSTAFLYSNISHSSLAYSNLQEATIGWSTLNNVQFVGNTLTASHWKWSQIQNSVLRNMVLTSENEFREIKSHNNHYHNVLLSNISAEYIEFNHDTLYSPQITNASIQSLRTNQSHFMGPNFQNNNITNWQNTLSTFADAKFLGDSLSYAVFKEVQFIGSQWDSVAFLFAQWSNASFMESEFTNLEFTNSTDFTSTYDSVTLHNTKYLNSIVEYPTLIHSHWSNPSADSSQFVQVDFRSSTLNWENEILTHTEFTQCLFDQSNSLPSSFATNAKFLANNLYFLPGNPITPGMYDSPVFLPEMQNPVLLEQWDCTRCNMGGKLLDSTIWGEGNAFWGASFQDASLQGSIFHSTSQFVLTNFAGADLRGIRTQSSGASTTAQNQQPFQNCFYDLYTLFSPGADTLSGLHLVHPAYPILELTLPANTVHRFSNISLDGITLQDWEVAGTVRHLQANNALISGGNWLFSLDSSNLSNSVLQADSCVIDSITATNIAGADLRQCTINTIIGTSELLKGAQFTAQLCLFTESSISEFTLDSNYTCQLTQLKVTQGAAVPDLYY